MPRPSTRFQAIGTHWQVDTDRPLDIAGLGALHDRIARFDADWSRFRPDSWVTRTADAGAGEYDLPGDAGPLLAAYDTAAGCTGGAVSPLVGRALEDLGYDADYRLRPRRDEDGELIVHPVPAWSDAPRADGRITLPADTLIDVGAAGKGYLVDLVSEVLTERGFDAHVVDAGGDIRVLGSTLRVALEDPADPARALGVLRVTDGAIAGSAPNRRAWGPGLHHVVDARTGRPTDRVLATWAVAPDALTADIAATALFFADPDLVAARFGIRYVVLDADRRLRWSLDLDGEVFA
ncbi:FAD:protein FMN transferase [Cellulomonas sp. RIT-PI-Y]|uniref:FAD:protein FMN transferase n=1 Tax=Cellulomonas sp. RIT-PI-Y TaxID=3035297 RepID=UPI0021D807EF|nr:FAD:protein FMN transferase [Cellulomonas sp. RIT-PI-Y]